MHKKIYSLNTPKILDEESELIQSDDEDVVNIEKKYTQPLSARFNLSQNDVH